MINKNKKAPVMALFRNQKLIMKGTEVEVMAYIHKNHSYSMEHAIKYEGYKVKRSIC